MAEPGTPATVGETVVIYCTGLGAVTPAVQEGLAAPTTPLSRTVNTVGVTIGGQAAQVAFSGLTPGYAGLYQVNAVVPSGITTGEAVPVVLSVAGQTSPVATIAVRYGADVVKLITLLLAVAVAFSQNVITTVVGTDSVFPAGGLPATSAQLRTALPPRHLP